MYHLETTRLLVRSHFSPKQSLSRFLFASLTVDDFVTVRASTFNTDQQLSTSGLQQFQYQSITNCKFQWISITC